MFGPLEFPAECVTGDETKTTNISGSKSEDRVSCVLCDNEYILPDRKDECLLHLFESHKLVIADVDQISNLNGYFVYWKQRFSERPITEFCSTIIADIKKDGLPLDGNEYYLLSDVHEEDKNIRRKFQNESLDSALTQQKYEREDTSFSHECLFCRQVIEPKRSDYINHLLLQHNLHLGKPLNLVYIDEFISVLENKLDNLQCIFCEKIFKDRNVLKEHMRKKLHKRVNPDNKSYDKYYITNYYGPNNHWKNERKRKDSEDEPCDWSDWQEILTLSIVCLFCEETFSSWENVTAHMKAKHHFDYEDNTMDLDFYEQVKLVNYIRRQIYKIQCINCDSKLSDRNDLMSHMLKENHLILPAKNLWNQPEFYFPTYENDAFLCQIDEVRDNKDELDSDLDNALSEINLLTSEDLPSPT